MKACGADEDAVRALYERADIAIAPLTKGAAGGFRLAGIREPTHASASRRGEIVSGSTIRVIAHRPVLRRIIDSVAPTRIVTRLIAVTTQIAWVGCWAA